MERKPGRPLETGDRRNKEKTAGTTGALTEAARHF